MLAKTAKRLEESQRTNEDKLARTVKLNWWSFRAMTDLLYTIFPKAALDPFLLSYYFLIVKTTKINFHIWWQRCLLVNCWFSINFCSGPSSNRLLDRLLSPSDAWTANAYRSHPQNIMSFLIAFNPPTCIWQETVHLHILRSRTKYEKWSAYAYLILIRPVAFN